MPDPACEAGIPAFRPRQSLDASRRARDLQQWMATLTHARTSKKPAQQKDPKRCRGSVGHDHCTAGHLRSFVDLIRDAHEALKRHPRGVPRACFCWIRAGRWLKHLLNDLVALEIGIHCQELQIPKKFHLDLIVHRRAS